MDQARFIQQVLDIYKHGGMAMAMAMAMTMAMALTSLDLRLLFTSWLIISRVQPCVCQEQAPSSFLHFTGCWLELYPAY